MAPRTRLAVIDLGSNSFRLVVFESGEGWWRRTDEIYEPVRIGEGLMASGRLGEEPIERALATLDVFAHFCHAGGLGAYLVPIFTIGGTIVLHRGFYAAETWRTIEREGCTVVLGVPTIFNANAMHAMVGTPRDAPRPVPLPTLRSYCVTTILPRCLLASMCSKACAILPNG